MINRTTRFARALWVESIKRIPYILVILVIIVLFQGYRTSSKVIENVEISRQIAESNQSLLKQVADLSEDNKNLSTQSNTLAERSNRYQSCIANLFAKYTRDYLPVIIDDLENCIVTSMVIPQPAPVSVPSPTTPTPTPEKPTKKSKNPISRAYNYVNGLIHGKNKK